MSADGGSVGLLRERGAHHRGRVTYVELFFDLVFVFAVTQLSHLLIGHLDAEGALETLLLLIAVWWAWIDTSWVTNWLDPQHPAVRLMLFALMFVGLMLAASIPEAFRSQALWFALAYAAMQVGRTLFMLWALRPTDRRNFLNFRRIAVWHALIAALWIGGALAAGAGRATLWLAAVVLECIAPAIGFAVPGLGRSTTAEWDVDGGHLAERCALFVIIALGESILVTGATAAGLAATPATIGAFTIAFLGSVAMWWIYFNVGEERGSRTIAGAADPGRLARAARAAAPSEAAVIVAGPALYLVGNLLFKRASARFLPLSHLAGLALLLALAAGSATLTPRLLGTATTAVLLLVAAWETLSLQPAVARST